MSRAQDPPPFEPTLRDLLPAWGIDPAAVTNNQPLGDRVWRLDLADGRQLVLKHVWDRLGEARLTLDADLMVHLHAQGVPVAVPLPTRSRPRFLTLGGDRRYTLSPAVAVSDDRLDESATDWNVGRALARLHRGLASFPHEIPSWTMHMPTRIYSECLPRCREHLRGAQLARFEAAFARFEPDSKLWLDPGNVQRLHGDCHGGNVLIHGNQVSAFVDMDHLPLGPRLYDIAYYLADRAKNCFDQPGRAGAWPRKIAGVLGGYAGVSPLTGSELMSLWPMMAAAQMLFVEVFATQGEVDALARNLAAFEWIVAQRQAVLRVLDR